MNNTEYPTLGTIVNFIRGNEKGDIFEGEGIVEAIHLDPRNRLMVRIKTNELDENCNKRVYNVDLMAINCDDDTKALYADALKDVVGITKEGNDMVQKTVASYNGKVDAIYNKLLGDPVSCETFEPVAEIVNTNEQV